MSESALKNAPVTPERKASGANTTMVTLDETTSGRVSPAAARRLPPAAPRSASMCSIITIASSMISPTAAAIPPSVMMLKLIPRTPSRSEVAASTPGTARSAISVTRQLRRKMSSTKQASATPISTASRTDDADSWMSSLWSYQARIRRSCGRFGRSRAISARTAEATATVFPVGCW